MIVDYVRGCSARAAREQAHRHLSSCLRCTRSLAGVARLMEIACAEIECCAPDDVIDEAISLFMSEPADRRVVADINSMFVDSSRQDPISVPLRGPGPESTSLPAVQNAADRDIKTDLLLIEENQVVTVAGQIQRAPKPPACRWERHRLSRVGHERDCPHSHRHLGGCFWDFSVSVTRFRATHLAHPSSICVRLSCRLTSIASATRKPKSRRDPHHCCTRQRRRDWMATRKNRTVTGRDGRADDAGFAASPRHRAIPRRGVRFDDSVPISRSFCGANQRQIGGPSIGFALLARRPRASRLRQSATRRTHSARQ